jgi:hypothetical protein
MQLRNSLALLVLSAAACSGADSTPTGPRPSFASGGGSCTVTFTPKGSNITASANSSGVARFIAKNVNCASNSDWLVNASRTGAVSGVTSVIPTTFFLTSGQSRIITVNFTTGAPGQGLVIGHAGVDNPPAELHDTVNVTVQ